MKVRFSRPRAARSALCALAVAGISAAAFAQETATTPEVRVLATKVMKKEVSAPLNTSIETAVVALRVQYADLSLNTSAGQALLKVRVADAAKDACARVGAAFRPGAHITSTAECVSTAIKDAQLQVEDVIAAANTESPHTL